VDETREAEELVGLWQELQAAQVAGDLRRLVALQRLAEGRARRPGASGEWALLAREAGRHTGDLHEEAQARPTAGVGETAASPPAELEPVVLPDGVDDAEEGPSESRRGFRLGPLIWLVIIVAYVLLQVLGNAGDGG
jgi:hypothetical protein